MSNQRSNKRREFVGAYVDNELKPKLIRAAKARGLTLADYLRLVICQSISELEEDGKESSGFDKSNKGGKK